MAILILVKDLLLGRKYGEYSIYASKDDIGDYYQADRKYELFCVRFSVKHR